MSSSFCEQGEETDVVDDGDQHRCHVEHKKSSNACSRAMVATKGRSEMPVFWVLGWACAFFQAKKRDCRFVFFVCRP